MKNTCPFYTEFQVLKVILVKTWKIQPPDLLFLVVFIRRSFYISRYHFSKIFRTSFNIIWKIDFQHEFSIFNKLTLLMLPYYLPTTCFNPKTARGGGNLTPPPCGFSKSVSHEEREKPWFFVTFNIILRPIFPQNFIRFSQVVQKIWRNSLSIYSLLIFINFHQCFGFFDITYLQKKLMTSAYNRWCQHFFTFNIC